MNILSLRLLCLPCVLAGGTVQKVSVDVTAVPINKNTHIKGLPAPPSDAPATVSWLGGLHLQARNVTDIFGGISGSHMNGSKLFMVSDTTRSGGAGRFFAGDLKLGPSDDLNGELIVPLDLQNVTTEPLKDEQGHYLLHSKINGDTESLGIHFPQSPSSDVQVVIGVERKHKVRQYEVPATSDGHLFQSIGHVAPSIMTDTGEDGVGHQLKGCTRGEGNVANNFGAEGVAFLSKSEFVVFCEYNKPGGKDDVTIGWIADYESGKVRATLELPLPKVPVSGMDGHWMRISSAVAVPGTNDLMFLFHYWGHECKSIIRMGRATLPDVDGDLAPKTLNLKLLTAPLRETEGYPIDNMETMNVLPTNTPGAYTIHILSDNNFNEKYQKTYLLSFLMKDKSKPAQLWSISGKLEGEPPHALSSIGVKTGLLVAAAALVTTIVAGAYRLHSQRHGSSLLPAIDDEDEMLEAPEPRGIHPDGI